MQIKNHRLYQDNGTPIPFRLSPNRSTRPFEHRFLVMHYTAGSSAKSAVNWFLNPDANASAHLVIGRDGSITQMVAFNQIAWHAGRSIWGGLQGLNKYSIGIELDNAGKMKKEGDHWVPWFGKKYNREDVLIAQHRDEDARAAWHTYTEKQLEVAIEVSALLVKKYGLKEVLGHDDIAPYRKVDPGPAFPMSSFRSRVIGRKDDDFIVFATTEALNIRLGPGTQYDKLPESPLPKNTQVDILKHSGSWCFVDVMDEINGICGLQGWLHSRYLTIIN